MSKRRKKRPTSRTSSKLKSPPLCEKCNKPGEKVTGAIAYPNKPAWSRHIFWVCKECDTKVSCHPNTDRPRGTIMVSKELGQARVLAHKAFDPLWTSGKAQRFKKREQAYAWLARKLKIPEAQCHFGEFDMETCQKAIKVCYALRFKKKNKSSK